MTNGYDLACPGYRTALRALGAPTLNAYGLTLVELVTSSVPHNAEGTEMECSRIATTLESLRRLSRQNPGNEPVTYAVAVAVLDPKSSTSLAKSAGALNELGAVI